MTTINRIQPMRPAEIDLLNQVDTNTANIATQTARLTQEIADRTNADNILQSNIDAEARARADADTALQKNIDTEESERKTADTTLQKNIDTEITDRQNADTNLQANINAEQTRAETTENTLTTNLNSEIDRAKKAEQSNATAIIDETTSRTNADTTLQESIDAVSGNITTEITDRQNADTNLQSSINEINAKFPVQTVNIGDAQVTSVKLEQTIKDQLTFLQSVPAQEFGTSNPIDVQANSNTSINIIFGSTKTEAPIVLCTLQHVSGNLSYVVNDVTNQQFSITVYNLSSTDASSVTINWLAISGR